MAQWEKFLLCKHENLNWDPQHPCKSWARLLVPITPLLGRRTQEDSGAGWPANRARSVSSRFSLKNDVGPERCLSGQQCLPPSVMT